MRTISRTIVSAIILSKDKKILLGKKDPNKGGVYANSWHIPGGGVDEGESQIDALAREMMEEVGIDTAQSKVSLFDDQGRGESVKKLPDGDTVLCKMQFNVYLIELPTNASETIITTSDDLTETIWTRKEELKNYQLTPPSVELFTRCKWL